MTVPRATYMPSALYRVYDAEGTLLYVGITVSAERFKQHQSSKKHWWHTVRTITLDWYETRAQCASAEAQAIATENPRHNIRTYRKQVTG